MICKIVEGNKIFISFEKQGTKVAIRFSQLETNQIKKALEGSK